LTTLNDHRRVPAQSCESDRQVALHPAKETVNVMGTLADAPLILVIDDDEAVLQVYQDLLEDEGYRLSLRAYPPSSMDDVRTTRPDLILLDLLFGAEDAGSSFLRKLKEDETTNEIPVLIATADQRLAEQHRPLFDAWQCEVILKPFDIDDLSTTLLHQLRGENSPSNQYVDAFHVALPALDKSKDDREQDTQEQTSHDRHIDGRGTAPDQDVTRQPPQMT
jgi:CheY-like chemotaxis protein